jgi:glycerophosphoryl diester phosphodiesterase
MESMILGILIVSMLLLATPGVAEEKIVIAHRGASGYLPEHTLEAYALAYAQGADYIEPDLVLTSDKRFICLHDIHLESTTDVEERYPERKRGDGRWCAADFTFEEIKTLRVHERVENRFPIGASRFEVPAFEEMIELIQGLNKTTGRNVGIYPELKSPSWHKKEGLPMEESFLEIVGRYGYKGPKARIFIQCFEAPTIQRIRKELHCDLPIIQLLSSNRLQASMVTEAGLDKIAEYASGIGPDKHLILKNPALVEWAHKRGLAVHPYTLRRDMLHPRCKTFEEELKLFYVTHDVDGAFTDFPNEAARFIATLPSR